MGLRRYPRALTQEDLQELAREIVREVLRRFRRSCRRGSRRLVKWLMITGALCGVVSLVLALDPPQTPRTGTLPEGTISCRCQSQTAGRGRSQGIGREAELRGLKRGLVRQLETKFGPIPAETRARIRALPSEEHVHPLLDRILEAESLEAMEWR